MPDQLLRDEWAGSRWAGEDRGADPGSLPAPAVAAQAARERDLLRFITCGSVDDGKSTLIGRLLYDNNQLFEDQIATLERDSKRLGTQGGELDLALALDGLAAEREQGITIDVAYRFFSTERRSFIVADTPGHEQYTRNMATGASTADAAILLVDARKGLSPQTRRHSLLVSMLGIRHVIVAVNKMDLVGFSQATFDEIMRTYRSFAADLGFRDVTGIPMSALRGDNVTRRSPDMPWYQGPDLLRHLETLDIDQDDSAAASGPARLAVQWVNRPDHRFRGFAGLVTGGALRAGQPVTNMPSGETTTIARIVTYDGDLELAEAGQAVTLVLADEVDVSRGSVIAAEAPTRLTGKANLRLFWMARAPLVPGSRFLVKVGTQVVGATVAEIIARIELGTLASTAATSLAPNDVGDVAVVFDRPVAVELFSENRDLGSVILIERESYDTVAMGLIQETATATRPAPAAEAWPPAIQAWLPSPFSPAWRSMLKTVSWRLLGTCLTVAAAYILTSDPRVALLLGLFELLVKFVLYFVHERLWARVGLGLRPPPLSPGK